MTAPATNMFSAGDELQVFSESRQKWFPGRVKAVGCRLLYGDGREKTRDATSSEIQRLSALEEAIQVGEHVKVYSDSQKEWLPGQIQMVLYTVEYLDGIVKTLPSDSNQLSKHDNQAKAPCANVFSAGDELQVFVEKEQKWIPGRVKSVSCVLLYGDGREKTRETTSLEVQRLNDSERAIEVGEPVKVYSDSQKEWLHLGSWLSNMSSFFTRTSTQL